jgi:SpoVK/Ycf46/Vps4 family AAA+-type ATPase
MSIQPFDSSLQHILAELERLDYLLDVQVKRVKETTSSNKKYQGLYISDQEVEKLLLRPIGMPRWALDQNSSQYQKIRSHLEKKEEEIIQRKIESRRIGVDLRLETIRQLFGLSPFDVDVLLICLAPEFDQRYALLYAYLQDDVTRKQPGVELVLNLFCQSFEYKLYARERFAPDSPLIKNRLLTLSDYRDDSAETLLNKRIKIEERILEFILGSNKISPALAAFARHIVPENRTEELMLPDSLKSHIKRVICDRDMLEKQMIFSFRGDYGSGKQAAAEAICHDLGLDLLGIDLDPLLNKGMGDFLSIIRLIHREANLLGSAVYWKGFDILLVEDRRSLLNDLINEIKDWEGIAFLGGRGVWEPKNEIHNQLFISVDFPYPNYEEREKIWRSLLNGSIPIEGDIDLNTLANGFRFTVGQIKDAIVTARNHALWNDPNARGLGMGDLFKGCRAQSNRKLEELSQRIIPKYTWDDIVLPKDQKAQLREICIQMKYKHVVYGKWGFERKVSLGRGLTILFSGPSGTGKTMAAEILGGELNLDLYKIDIATVVSKYIGETEKNLSKIFKEAETSNAILFFDEADAIFGKRSEVKDAHDRYSNIEIAFLLQKMEEYEGITILASNLRSNIDESFVRRMQFIVEFPFPDEDSRFRIWKGLFPAEAPVGGEVDFRLLAKNLNITGGNIKNIGLKAAHVAAANGKKVRMEHLIEASKRELQKTGMLYSDADFMDGKVDLVNDTRM